MKTNPNDNAYPHHTMVGGELPVDPNRRGLSKLEAFTMAAMQGLCANTDYSQLGFDSLAKYAMDIATKTIYYLNDNENRSLD